jgi:hypothetical protein
MIALTVIFRLKSAPVKVPVASVFLEWVEKENPSYPLNLTNAGFAHNPDNLFFIAVLKT